MGFAVGTKACLAVLLEIELLSENDFPWESVSDTPDFVGYALSQSTTW